MLHAGCADWTDDVAEMVEAHLKEDNGPMATMEKP
jgi:hypothetical protein